MRLMRSFLILMAVAAFLLPACSGVDSIVKNARPLPVEAKDKGKARIALFFKGTGHEGLPKRAYGNAIDAFGRLRNYLEAYDRVRYKVFVDPTEKPLFADDEEFSKRIGNRLGVDGVLWVTAIKTPGSGSSLDEVSYAFVDPLTGIAHSNRFKASGLNATTVTQKVYKGIDPLLSNIVKRVSKSSIGPVSRGELRPDARAMTVEQIGKKVESSRDVYKRNPQSTTVKIELHSWAWELALALDDRDGYVHFAKTYPDSLYTNLAEKLILTAEARAKPTVPVPAASGRVKGTPRVAISDEPKAGDGDARVAMRGKVSNPDAVAVVIGNGKYESKYIPEVDYALSDAGAMRDFLIERLGYSQDNIIYLENAGLTEFFKIFGTEKRSEGKLSHWVKAGKSDVFIYYTGHGAPDVDTGSAYFVPTNSDPDYIANSGYPLELFWKNLATIQARKMTVVLDTCFSGNSQAGFLLRNVSPAMLKVDVQLKGPAGATIMTSSAPDQISTWYPEKEASLFTYWWLKGAEGLADADGDSSITVEELGAYLTEKVGYYARRLSGRNQAPVTRGRPDEVLVAY